MQITIIALALIILVAVIGFGVIISLKFSRIQSEIDDVSKSQTDVCAKVQRLESSFDVGTKDILEQIRSSERNVEETVVKTADRNDGRTEARLSSLSSSVDRMKTETSDRISEGFSSMREETGNSLKETTSLLSQTLKAEAESREVISETLTKNLERIGKMTEDKLSEIRKDVSDKLDSSLNRRLDESFEKVSSQLSLLYRSLGELGEMSSGIASLNKTLSNVKNRGTWGEIRLGSVIEDVLAPSQYERNVRTNPKSQDVVEFALKIPSRDSDASWIYLPVDSKFPTDAYSAVVSASESGDAEAVKKAEKELERRILDEAKKISEKYLNPPVTTDFAVMFLPSESLYAEVMRIDGLAQRCQVERRVVIASPSTTAALLNSLQVGFAAVAVSRKTSEIRNLLSAVKAQYEKLDDLVDKVRKQIEQTSKNADELKKRTGMIRKKLASAGEMSPEDAERMIAGDSDSVYENAVVSELPEWNEPFPAPPEPGEIR